MREKIIEQALVDEVKNRSGLCLKWICYGHDGMPDRLVFLPGGKFAMVEVKSKGKKPRPLQSIWHSRLRSLGFKVYVLDDKNSIGGILDEIQST